MSLQAELHFRMLYTSTVYNSCTKDALECSKTLSLWMIINQKMHFIDKNSF